MTIFIIFHFISIRMIIDQCTFPTTSICIQIHYCITNRVYRNILMKSEPILTIKEEFMSIQITYPVTVKILVHVVPYENSILICFQSTIIIRFLSTVKNGMLQ